MSKKHTEKIACSLCHIQQQFTVWDSVNVTIDPALKLKLFKGELTTFTCKNCSSKLHVKFDCLYHDMENELLIWLKYPDGKGFVDNELSFRFPFAETYIFRTVCSFEELIEKVSIFDDRLSDYAIELMKLIICIREGIDIYRPLYYAGTGFTGIRKTVNLILKTEKSFEERCYDMKEYSHLSKTIMPKLSSSINSNHTAWPRVNREFIHHMLEKAGLISKKVGL